MSETGRSKRSADTREAIMEATYRALRTHGYVGLTMQSIADEFDKSKAAIHYHYNTKEELLTAFLEYFLDQFVEELPNDAEAGPEERVRAIIESLMIAPNSDAEERDQYTALLEIRSHAPRHAAFREQFTANHRFLEDLLTESIEQGIETGAFRSVDARANARLVLATTLGARVYALTLDDEAVSAGIEDALETNVMRTLIDRE